MKDKNLIKYLQDRDLIVQITNKIELINKLSKEYISIYCGFDPTSDSLHIGHLIPLLCLKYFQIHGHQLIILIGGATGLIGDPSFKSHERSLNSIETIKKWINNITQQIYCFFNNDNSSNKPIIINNFDWFKKMNTLFFLRDIGKYFTINKMINKEAIKQRLNRNYSGLSFTEFSYNLLQSYDFTYLNKKFNVILQIGGSDQWGNIISGIDLTKHINKNTVYGITVPLITHSNGKKIGKTEKDTIWLDPQKTNPYTFYQFWINTSDQDVYKFLKLFTMIDINTINELQIKNEYTKYMRIPQLLLADEITKMIHGINILNNVKQITYNLFTQSLSKLSKEDFLQCIKVGVSHVLIKNDHSLVNALIISGMATSKKHARQLIQSKAITINGKKQTSIEYRFCNSDKLYNQFIILKKGKKQHSIIIWK